MIMIMVPRLMLQYIYGPKPLDHPSTNISGNNESNRKPMIGLQCLAVGFVCNNDVVSRVHYAREWDGGSVFDEFPPWFGRKGSRTDFVGKVFDSNEFYVFVGHVLELWVGGGKNK
jgi:hypothetical protein